MHPMTWPKDIPRPQPTAREREYFSDLALAGRLGVTLDRLRDRTTPEWRDTLRAVWRMKP